MKKREKRTMDAAIGRKLRQAVREAGINERGTEHGNAVDGAGAPLPGQGPGRERVTETPEGMFRRVARNLSEAETEYGAGEERRQEIGG